MRTNRVVSGSGIVTTRQHISKRVSKLIEAKRKRPAVKSEASIALMSCRVEVVAEQRKQRTRQTC